MARYEIGKPFPDKRFLEYEGVTIRSSGSGIEVIMVLNGVSGDELSSFNRGIFTYGLFIEKEIPCFVLEFEGIMKGSYPINVYRFGALAEWLSQPRNQVTIFFINKISGYIVAIRAFYAHQNIISTLREGLITQNQVFASWEDIECRIEDIEANPETSIDEKFTTMYPVL